MANARETSEDLAGHIVDALTKAGLIRPDEYEQAVGIILEELDANAPGHDD